MSSPLRSSSTDAPPRRACRAQRAKGTLAVGLAALFAVVSPIASAGSLDDEAPGAAAPSSPEAPPPGSGAADARPAPPPLEWLPSRGRGPCGRQRGRRYCDGPRRVPRPVGPAAELVERFQLNRPRTYAVLTERPAPPELVEVVTAAPGEGLLYPVEGGTLGRGFGYVRGGRLRSHIHKGVDIFAPVGTPIRAANGGLVVYADNGITGYGNFLMVLDAEGRLAAYAHCKAIHVSAGQLVRQGEVVAEVGTTGMTQGAHVHFEWRKDGRLVDPAPAFVGRPERPER